MKIGVLPDTLLNAVSLISAIESPETLLGPSESLILTFKCQIDAGSSLNFRGLHLRMCLLLTSITLVFFILLVILELLRNVPCHEDVP